MAQTKQTIREIIPAKEQEFADVLKSRELAKRFVIMAVNTINSDPALLGCRPESIMDSLMQIATFGLTPSKAMGHVALIPYNGECTFQLMYRGILVLAYRSGNVVSVVADTARAVDAFQFMEGSDGFVDFVKSLKDRREDSPPQAVFTVFQMKHGKPVVGVMPWYEVEAIRETSKAWKAGGKAAEIWLKWPDQMGWKTLIKRVSKLLPVGEQFAEAMAVDESNWVRMEETGLVVPAHAVNSTPAKFRDRPGLELKNERPNAQGTAADQVPDFLKRPTVPFETEPPVFVPDQEPEMWWEL